MSATNERTEETTTIDIFGATLTRSTFVKGGGAYWSPDSASSAPASAPRRRRRPPTTAGRARSTRRSRARGSTSTPTTRSLLRTGKVELGQGSASTAFAMITAEELNVPYSAITQVIMGDTDRTPDGGFSAGYMGGGSPNVRMVAAYVYQALLSLASTQLGVPVASLTVTNGVVSGGGKSVSYGQLVSGQSLNLTIPVTGVLPNGAFGVTVLGNPPTKPISRVQDHRHVDPDADDPADRHRHGDLRRRRQAAGDAARTARAPAALGANARLGRHARQERVPEHADRRARGTSSPSSTRRSTSRSRLPRSSRQDEVDGMGGPARERQPLRRACAVFPGGPGGARGE